MSKAFLMRWLLVPQSPVSHFYVRIDFRERNTIEKKIAKPLENDVFATPQKHTKVL
jgi:hypothetical protein